MAKLELTMQEQDILQTLIHAHPRSLTIDEIREDAALTRFDNIGEGLKELEKWHLVRNRIIGWDATEFGRRWEAGDFT